MLVNYHTHTWRCGHASGREREYVEAAIKAGIQVLGFSDHTPYPFPDGHESSFRMSLEQAAGYFETISELRREYAGQLELHIGLEAEYYPRCFGVLLDFLKDFPCEYLILGQHFTNNETDGVPSGAPTRDEAVLCRYVDQVLEAMGTGKFTYAAHPDVLNWKGSPEIYERQMRRLCRGARDMNVPLEINGLGLYDGRNYPNRAFWQIAGGEGCAAVIGCDAHQPEALDRPQIEAAARTLAAECGLTVLETVPLIRPV